jgi:hypothetical protein
LGFPGRQLDQNISSDKTLTCLQRHLDDLAIHLGAKLYGSSCAPGAEHVDHNQVFRHNGFGHNHGRPSILLDWLPIGLPIGQANRRTQRSALSPCDACDYKQKGNDS